VFQCVTANLLIYSGLESLFSVLFSKMYEYSKNAVLSH